MWWIEEGRLFVTPIVCIALFGSLFSPHRKRKKKDLKKIKHKTKPKTGNNLPNLKLVLPTRSMTEFSFRNPSKKEKEQLSQEKRRR